MVPVATQLHKSDTQYMKVSLWNYSSKLLSSPINNTLEKAQQPH